MNGKRVHFLMLGLIALLMIGLLAGAYGANGLLGTKAASLVQLKAKSSALEKEQAALIIAKQQLMKYSVLNNIAKAIVPQDKDQAETVRELVKLANEHGVGIGSITYPASSLGIGKSVPSAGSASSSGASNKPFTVPGVNAQSAALSQLQIIKNIPGVYSLQIKIDSDPDASTSYAQLIGYLSALENNRRTAEVSTISFLPSPKYTGKITFSITLNEYIKP